jgi:predicted GIY-YIG superfamily endonuclease
VAANAYILRCADGKLYYGSTGDLRRRVEEHRAGLTRWTSLRLPVELVWFQEFETTTQARRKEQSLKSGRTRRKVFDRMIAQFPPKLLAPFA